VFVRLISRYKKKGEDFQETSLESGFVWWWLAQEEDRNSFNELQKEKNKQVRISVLS